jgi:hypothetical protein
MGWSSVMTKIAFGEFISDLWRVDWHRLAIALTIKSVYHLPGSSLKFDI